MAITIFDSKTKSASRQKLVLRDRLLDSSKILKESKVANYEIELALSAICAALAAILERNP